MEFTRKSASRAGFGKIYIWWLKSTTSAIGPLGTPIVLNLNGLGYIEPVKRTRSSITNSQIKRANARARKGS